MKMCKVEWTAIEQSLEDVRIQRHLSGRCTFAITIYISSNNIQLHI